jgi:ribose transport system substrate-binding protein
MTRLTRGLPLAVVAAAVAFAGCGSGSDSDSGTTAGARTTTSASGGGVVAEAKAALERQYAGTDRALPTSGPKAVRGKKVWVIPCSAAAAGCQGPAQAVVAAGKVLGWKMTLVDGKLDPNVYNAQIRAAIAARADAIVLVVIDCSLTQASLQAAHAAGVKLYGAYSLDCNEAGGTGKPLFDAQVNYGTGTYQEYVASYGRLAADYVIAKTDGKAKVVMMRENDTAVVRLTNDAFEREIKRCAGCQLITVNFSGQDLIGGKLEAKTTTALTQHPDASAVMAPYDASILLGIGPAVAAAKAQGRKIILTGIEGLAPNIELIKKGTQDMIAGVPNQWIGWAAADGLNRLLAGEPQVDAGIGTEVVDATHPVPTKTPYYDGNAKSADYRTNYERIWGVG